MNIYQKMAEITAEMKTVGKNLDVTAGKTSYKAVSERDVIDAVKEVEGAHGIYSYPFSRETLESEQLESESTYNGNVTKKTTFYTRIKTIYRFVNIDKPEEYIDMTVFSVGLDSQDKGDGKAMTYGDKYALMKAYKISTGDDPDEVGSNDEDYSRKPKKQTKQTKPTERSYETSEEKPSPPADKPSPPADKPVFRCAVCGEILKPYADSKGNNVSLRAHAEKSQRVFGKIMCRDCIEKANAGKDS